MKIRFLRTTLNLFLLALWAFPSGAQSPIGPEFRVNSTTSRFQGEASLAYDETGRLVIAWESFRPFEEDDFLETSEIYAKRYSASGEVLGEDLIKSGAMRPFVVARSSENFTVTWGPDDPFSLLSGFWGHRFSWVSGSPVGGEFEIQPWSTQSRGTGATGLPAGGLFAIWIGQDRPFDPACVGCEYGAFGGIIDATGNPMTDIFQINDDAAGTQVPWGAASDAAGNIVVTWWSNPAGDGSDADVMARRYSPSGERLGPAFRVNTITAGEQAWPSVASDPAGNFVVTWDGDGEYLGSCDIYGQRLQANGEKVGSEFRVNTVTISDQFFSRVAMDRFGNFIVVWQSNILDGLRSWDIEGQLFRHDGTSVGKEFTVNTTTSYGQTDPHVAFGPNGIFTVTWQSDDESDDNHLSEGVFAQRFSASPGDEPCLVRGGRILCDTGRTGGEAEIETVFGGRPGETSLMGDFDGDGREDLCARFGSRFRCDLDHRGAPAEAVVKFGLSGDIALMGDLDGDGKAEPCVRRKRRFLCDSAHDGGRAETAIVLGLISDMPLIGDLDGDGKDDPCLYRNGIFLCDTAHDGSAAEVAIAFGEAGDLPTLGDLDGDGRDDPCVLRAGHFLCDLAHDGGAAELDLRVEAGAGDLPLMGNLDGL
ncbi:MAG TPA: hypothetical protein VGX68_29295 [Thermoanaerobaculia bacterium]|nr:hypothetical protein [Thermoanaerobaculia bacterium]